MFRSDVGSRTGTKTEPPEGHVAAAGEKSSVGALGLDARERKTLTARARLRSIAERKKCVNAFSFLDVLPKM